MHNAMKMTAKLRLIGECYKNLKPDMFFVEYHQPITSSLTEKIISRTLFRFPDLSLMEHEKKWRISATIFRYTKEGSNEECEIDILLTKNFESFESYKNFMNVYVEKYTKDDTQKIDYSQPNESTYLSFTGKLDLTPESKLNKFMFHQIFQYFVQIKFNKYVCVTSTV